MGVLLGGGLFPSSLFVPTRFNPADAPTRYKEAPLREHAQAPWLQDGAALRWALSRPPMARWLGAWVRLVWRQLGAGVEQLAAPLPERRPWISPVRGALLASGLRPRERLDLRALRPQAEVACPQLVRRASPRRAL